MKNLEQISIPSFTINNRSWDSIFCSGRNTGFGKGLSFLV